jgi:hypothetical protein
VRLHRNNAAEWAMVIALTPVAWAIRVWRRIGRWTNDAESPGGSLPGDR